MNHIELDKTKLYPTKVICIGRNYVEHIQELNNEMPTEPVIFMKPNSAISASLNVDEKTPIHYEGELCFLIKNDRFYGIGFGLDLTKRELQTSLKSKGLPWERAKAFDKSAVFSDFIQCESDIENYKIELFINEQLIQHADYELMIHKPETLLKEIQSFCTLEDGDIIMTGTPKGVGVVHLGDTFTAKVYYQNKLVINQSWLAQ